MKGREPDLEERLRSAVELALGRRPARVAPLVGGLATRRFFRVELTGAPRSLVARMDLPEDPAGRPPGVPPEPDLEPVRAAFEAAGLPVPRRLGAGPGIELLEDVGDHPLDRVLLGVNAERRRALYREALALVPRIQRLENLPPATRARRLDATLVAYKADLFLRTSLPAILGRAPRPSEAKVVTEAFGWIASRLAAAPVRPAHRDLQSRNLHLYRRPGEPERLFLLDLQGACLAPPEYDAASLLHDSYVELDEEEIAALAEWLRPCLPDAPDPESFAVRFDLVTVVRKAKDHARYLAAIREDRDPGYLGPALGRAARSLIRAARRRAGLDARLAELAELVGPIAEAPCVP